MRSWKAQGPQGDPGPPGPGGGFGAAAQYSYADQASFGNVKMVAPPAPVFARGGFGSPVQDGVTIPVTGSYRISLKLYSDNGGYCIWVNGLTPHDGQTGPGGGFAMVETMVSLNAGDEVAVASCSGIRNATGLVLTLQQIG